MKKELEAIQTQLQEELQTLQLKIKAKQDAISTLLIKTNKVKKLSDEIKIDFGDMKPLVEKKIVGAIEMRAAMQKQHTEAQEKYRGLLGEQSICIEELAQYQAEHNQKYDRYLKLSISLAQIAVENHSAAPDGALDKDSFLKLTF